MIPSKFKILPAITQTLEEQRQLSSALSPLLSPPSSKQLRSRKWPQLTTVDKRIGLEFKREICAEKGDEQCSWRTAAGSDRCVLCTCIKLPKSKILKFLNPMQILRLSITSHQAFPLKGTFQKNGRGVHVFFLKIVNWRALDSEQNMMYSQKTRKPALLLPPAV